MTNNSDLVLSVIVISYNTAELTTQCLKSLIADLALSKFLSKSSEIVVVDNHSTDNSINVIEKLIKQSTQQIPIKLIKNQINLGFSKANNLAIKNSRGKYLLLLNSDTVVQTGALESLIKNFQNPNRIFQQYQLGLIAASLWNPDDTYQPQGGNQISLLAAACQWLMLDDLPLIGKFLPTLQHRDYQLDHKLTLQPMGWVAATALCFPRKLYDSIGGLDESIFMYSEDLEFCLRAQRRGWGSAIAYPARITHLGSASSTSSQAKLGEVKGLLKIWPKYFGNFSTTLLKLIILIGSCQRIILFTLLGRNQQVLVYKQILNLL